MYNIYYICVCMCVYIYYGRIYIYVCIFIYSKCFFVFYSSVLKVSFSPVVVDL